MLPEDLKRFSVERGWYEQRDKLWGAAFFGMFLIALITPDPAPKVEIVPPQTSARWGDTLVACMKGGTFFYEDVNHEDVAVKCSVEKLGRVVSIARAK